MTGGHSEHAAPRPWTAELVLAELARAFATKPVLYSSPRSALLAPTDRIAELRQVNGRQHLVDLLELSEAVLGRDSRERVALLVRARALGRPGGPSIREICRERHWRGSR